MNVIAEAKKLKLSLGEYVVCGSAVMDVLGIRAAKDIDLIVTKAIYVRLKSEGWREEVFPSPGRHHSLFKGNFDASFEWSVNKYQPDPTRLITKAMIIEGVPFVQLEELLAWKRAAVRDKDKADIKLIEHYLAQTA